MSWNLQKEIKEILATEIGTQIFAPGRRTPVAFLYPNTYHLGMSNLGLHILYQNENSSVFHGDPAPVGRFSVYLCHNFF